VQSWLASAVYGVAERAGGLAWVRIEQGVLYGLLGFLVGTLCRTGLATRTALAGALAVGLGAGYWSPRPLAFGLVGMALTILAVERRWAWWWLLPVVWVWVNSHGSFVLGLGWLALVAVGERLDGERRPSVLPWLGGFAAGLVLACANPLGVRLLVFPFVVLDRRSAFAEVAEWKPPFAAISRPGTALALACLVGVAVVAIRFRSRLRWRDGLPLVAFAVAALVAQRNLPMAAIVCAPVLARLLAPDLAPTEDRRPSTHVIFAALLAALAALFLVVAATSPAPDLRGYPVRASSLYDHPSKVLTTDIAAGYLLLRHRDRVWFDDRVDLHPVAKTKDYVRLLHGDDGAMAIVDRSGADVVVWKTDEELDAQLAASGRWRRVGVRDGWAVWTRAG
jgi:hypothetical protein